MSAHAAGTWLLHDGGKVVGIVDRSGFLQTHNMRMPAKSWAQRGWSPVDSDDIPQPLLQKAAKAACLAGLLGDAGKARIRQVDMFGRFPKDAA